MRRIVRALSAAIFATIVLSPPIRAQVDAVDNARISLPNGATVALCAHILRRYSVVPSGLDLGWLQQVPAPVAASLSRARLYDPNTVPVTQIDITAAHFRGRCHIDLAVSATFARPKAIAQHSAVGAVRLVKTRGVWSVALATFDIRDETDLPVSAEVQAVMRIAARHPRAKTLYMDFGIQDSALDRLTVVRPRIRRSPGSDGSPPGTTEIGLVLPQWLSRSEVLDEYWVDRVEDHDQSQQFDGGVVDLSLRDGAWRARVLPYDHLPSLSNRQLPVDAQLAVYEGFDNDPEHGYLVVDARPSVARMLRSRHYRLLREPLDNPSNAIKAAGYMEVGLGRPAWIRRDTAIIALGTTLQTPGNDVVYEHQGFAIVSNRSGHWTSDPFHMRGE